MVPLLQAKVGQHIPDLRYKFDRSGGSHRFCSLASLKTQLASFLYFVTFSTVNYLATKDLEKLQSKDITYWNEFGQELYGLLSIFLAVVGGLYICWYRAFVHWDYQCSCVVLLIFLVL